MAGPLVPVLTTCNAPLQPRVVQGLGAAAAALARVNVIAVARDRGMGVNRQQWPVLDAAAKSAAGLKRREARRPRLAEKDALVRAVQFGHRRAGFNLARSHAGNGPAVFGTKKQK